MPCLRHGVRQRHRATVAAAIRDDAKRATMIAAVLDAQKGTGAPLHPVDRMALGCPLGHDVTDMGLGRHVAGERAPGLRLQLAVIAHQLVDTVERRVGLGRDLRRTAGHDDPGVGSRAPGSPDRLAGLTLGLGRDRAGVDDHQIVQTGRLRMPAHHLGFEGVEAAAEGDDVDRAHGPAGSGWPMVSGSNVPVKLSDQEPVMATDPCPDQASSSSPPSKIRVARSDARPRRTAAAMAAQAPLPQASVRPAPRSKTRRRNRSAASTPGEADIGAAAGTSRDVREAARAGRYGRHRRRRTPRAGCPC